MKSYINVCVVKCICAWYMKQAYKASGRHENFIVLAEGYNRNCPINMTKVKDFDDDYSLDRAVQWTIEFGNCETRYIGLAHKQSVLMRYYAEKRVQWRRVLWRLIRKRKQLLRAQDDYEIGMMTLKS